MSDSHIRHRAFAWLEEQTDLHGDVLSRRLLAEGFVLEGEQIRFVGPQGIFKPAAMELPLSITTVPSGPYEDSFDRDGLLLYKYRGEDPGHRDNVGLREAMKGRVPLVYFYAIDKGKYVGAWPVFVVGDNPVGLTFTVAVDDERVVSVGSAAEEVGEESPVPSREADARRGYVTRVFRQRLHQQEFRQKVLRAYRVQCALCKLRHQELLDAAHIIPDSDPEGRPVVPNGLALCKLHHAAFDRHFVGIRGDYVVEVRRSVLEEEDGPMLKHGLQGMQGMRILLPRARELRPDRERLARRYERFREVG